MTWLSYFSPFLKRPKVLPALFLLTQNWCHCLISCVKLVLFQKRILCTALVHESYLKSQPLWGAQLCLSCKRTLIHTVLQLCAHFFFFNIKWAQIINGGRSGTTLSSAKSAIYCWLDFPACSLQNKHFAMTLFTVKVLFVIQNFLLTIEMFWFLPPWPSCMWNWWRLEICWSFARLKGCFMFSGMAEAHPVAQGLICRSGYFCMFLDYSIIMQRSHLGIFWFDKWLLWSSIVFCYIH